MIKNKKKKKPRIPTFSDRIDNFINGYAIGLSFMGIGIFLLLKPSCLFAPFISYLIGSVIGAFGAIGVGIELNRSTSIKGIDTLAIGAVSFSIWMVVYIKFKNPWTNFLFFICLVFGCYGIVRGLIEGVYSVYLTIKAVGQNKEQSADKGLDRGNAVTTVLLFFTQLCGLIVAMVNVFKAFGG